MLVQLRLAVQSAAGVIQIRVALAVEARILGASKLVKRHRLAVSGIVTAKRGLCLQAQTRCKLGACHAYRPDAYSKRVSASRRTISPTSAGVSSRSLIAAERSWSWTV